MITDYRFKLKNLLSFCLICWCGSAVGQQQSPALVELMYDDEMGISGELLACTNGQYFLKTSVGVIAVDENSVSCKGSGCPDPDESTMPLEDIKLTSVDGAMVLSGELLEIKESMYVIETSVGVVEIDIASVACQGNGCVVPAPTE